MLLVLELRVPLKYIYMRFPGSGGRQRMPEQKCATSSLFHEGPIQLVRREKDPVLSLTFQLSVRPSNSRISRVCTGYLFWLPHQHLSTGKSAQHKFILLPALAGDAHASAGGEVRVQAVSARSWYRAPVGCWKDFIQSAPFR